MVFPPNPNQNISVRLNQAELTRRWKRTVLAQRSRFARLPPATTHLQRPVFPVLAGALLWACNTDETSGRIKAPACCDESGEAAAGCILLTARRRRFSCRFSASNSFCSVKQGQAVTFNAADDVRGRNSGCDSWKSDPIKAPWRVSRHI